MAKLIFEQTLPSLYGQLEYQKYDDLNLTAGSLRYSNDEKTGGKLKMYLLTNVPKTSSDAVGAQGDLASTGQIGMLNKNFGFGYSNRLIVGINRRCNSRTCRWLASAPRRV